MTERERERHRELLTKYALPPYDFITDDMTVPFAIELAEKDAKIARLQGQVAAAHALKRLREDDIERLQEAKRRALAIADERGKESDALRQEIERLTAALESCASWIDRWTKHVGACEGGNKCTCGRTAVLYEARNVEQKANHD